MDTHDFVGTWQIDPAHSRLGFSVRHAMITKIRGGFPDFDGEAHIDPDRPACSWVRITARTASLDTQLAERDRHLRSPDFFDVETYPEMLFTSERIEEPDDADEGDFLVIGELTIRDITKPLRMCLQFTGTQVDVEGRTRAGLEGSRRIDRREWDVRWNTRLDSGAVLISDKVTLEFDLELVRLD